MILASPFDTQVTMFLSIYLTMVWSASLSCGFLMWHTSLRTTGTRSAAYGKLFLLQSQVKVKVKCLLNPGLDEAWDTGIIQFM